MIIPTRPSTKVTNLKPVSTMGRLVDSSKRHLFPGRRHLFGGGANAATFRRYKWEKRSTGDASLSQTFTLCVGNIVRATESKPSFTPLICVCGSSGARVVI
jgi:hypothetical protein